MACGEDHPDGKFPRITPFEQKMIDIKTKLDFEKMRNPRPPGIYPHESATKDKNTVCLSDIAEDVTKNTLRRKKHSKPAKRKTIRHKKHKDCGCK